MFFNVLDLIKFGPRISQIEKKSSKNRPKCLDLFASIYCSSLFSLVQISKIRLVLSLTLYLEQKKLFNLKWQMTMRGSIFILTFRRWNIFMENSSHITLSVSLTHFYCKQIPEGSKGKNSAIKLSQGCINHNKRFHEQRFSKKKHFIFFL
jgi:hypothetical protein